MTVIGVRGQADGRRDKEFFTPNRRFADIINVSKLASYSLM